MSVQNRPSRLPFFLFLLVLLAAAYGAYNLFFSGKHATPLTQMQMPPAPVSVLEVKTEDIPLTYEYAGRSAGSREVEIRARVSGILQKRAYEEGQWVKKGDVLFKIDPAPFEAALGQADAKYNQAQKDWERVSNLYKAKAVSAREYDEARSAYEQSQAEVKTARINLGYTTVTAPISGVTSKEGLSEGSLVSADTSLLTRLTQLDPIYIDFAYPDTEVIAQRQQLAGGNMVVPEKLTAEIRFGNGQVYKQQGTIDFTDSIIDPQTGTVHARAVLPNNKDGLLPGQFVRVIVKGIVRKNAIAVPDQAVMQGPQGAFVYVVDAKGNAAIQPVVLGVLSDKKRVIDSGLKPGDKVITEGMIKVHPGAPVAVGAPSATGAADKPAATPDGKPVDKSAGSPAKKE